ncbi:lasso peptide biosynthesis B2 protein [Nodosilinea sp. P-1105]|uniref:lasso peptide biosynthesis B2 protein n=1 Tax=Nodosilinea sp. P-1105 TaxID=2546229 RepID=UPI00146C76DB|nr:lasso peptide biosynthesis B2 protein [Nodosilinea sp. P-1105]
MVLVGGRRKLKILWQLSWNERWITAQSFILLPAIALSLSLFGLPITQRYLAQLSPVDIAKTDLAFADVKRMAFAVNRAANHSPLWGNCLKRSLTLWFVLRRRQILSDLRIGVRRHEGEFQAHAWIEYEGAVLNDRPTVYQLYSAFKETFDDGIYVQRPQGRA